MSGERQCPVSPTFLERQQGVIQIVNWQRGGETAIRVGFLKDGTHPETLARRQSARHHDVIWVQAWKNQDHWIIMTTQKVARRVTDGDMILQQSIQSDYFGRL